VADAAIASKLAPTGGTRSTVGASLLAMASDRAAHHLQSWGFSGRFDGLFFCLEEIGLYISIMHNQMNKYDLWIYKSAVKVTPSKRDRKPRIANTVQGIV
jgi:hypothetical protein